MSLIKVRDLAFVRMAVPDLDAASKFFRDFGLIETQRDHTRAYYRGLGGEQQLLIAEVGERRMVSTAFEIASREDLDLAAHVLGSPIQERDEPGDGVVVRVRDPDGNLLELVHGIAERDPLFVDGQQMNGGRDRYRPAGELCRPPIGPSHVLRLGHTVITTPVPDTLAAWYRDTFGFLISDEVFADVEKTELVLSFNRLDRGEEFVDHHTFQTVKGPVGGVHHVSFEVLDIDDLQCGGDHLSQQGYRRMWGVGRHKQGSQIFDYWIDPFGMMYEHWTDTDVLNALSPAQVETVETSMGPWGPPPPAEFLTQVA